MNIQRPLFWHQGLFLQPQHFQLADLYFQSLLTPLHNFLQPYLWGVQRWEIAEAAPDFHPRYSARSRRYQYTVYNAPIRWPLARRYSLHVGAPLDVEAMQRATRTLIGEQDFATFGQPPQGKVTVRRALVAEWGGEPPWLTFDIEANAFLYRMVRSIVGTLLQVGRGELSVERFAALLASCDRSQAGPTAPPHGLCLMKVNYKF